MKASRRISTHNNRGITLEEAARRVAASKGARQRQLTARHLLLHLDEVPGASVEELQALDEYIERRGWKSMFYHDRRMYQLLKQGAQQYERLRSSKSSSEREPHAKEAQRAIVDPRVEAAHARGTAVRERLLAAEGGSISAGQAAEQLGIGRTSLLRQYRAGKVIGWKGVGEEIHFPVWQFKGRGLMPGLPEVLAALGKGCRLDDIGRILFFLSQFSFVGNRRPLDLLREGRISDAMLAAQGFTQV